MCIALVLMKRRNKLTMKRDGLKLDRSEKRDNCKRFKRRFSPRCKTLMFTGTTVRRYVITGQLKVLLPVLMSQILFLNMKFRNVSPFENVPMCLLERREHKTIIITAVVLFLINIEK